jgi:hypothetical protein
MYPTEPAAIGRDFLVEVKGCPMLRDEAVRDGFCIVFLENSHGSIVTVELLTFAL